MHPNAPVAATDGAVPACEAHGVAHTGKLARSIILDLATHDALRPGSMEPGGDALPPTVAPATGGNPERFGDGGRGTGGAPAVPSEDRPDPAYIPLRGRTLLLRDRLAEAAWRRATTRARWVVARLGIDPEHGGRIFLPGRLDPRNASTSLIDAGECVDALATLALHPRFRELPDAERLAVLGAINDCAESYLAGTVASKSIVNQVLWGAMGLAHACSVFPSPHAPGGLFLPDVARWREAVVQAVEAGVDRQRPDGSWGYEASSARAHPGVADLSVYYHGRCLAFLRHATQHVPSADVDGRASMALRRGVEFLMAVRAPDGTKSLALEGKRWFWASMQEVGSLAYDIYALARASNDLGDATLAGAALASWRTLCARIDAAGAVRAGDGVLPIGDAADAVCRDFHVADLAWVARSVGFLWPEPRLPAFSEDSPGAGHREVVSSYGGASYKHASGPASSGGGATPMVTRRTMSRDRDSSRSAVMRFDAAGVVRLEVGRAFAIVRVAKAPCNAQWGGAIGGGTVVATHAGAAAWRDGADTPGSVTVRLASPGAIGRVRAAVAGARRYNEANRFGREWRQLAFTLRVLARSVVRHLRHGHLIAAARFALGVGVQAWRIAGKPLMEAIDDVATAHWAVSVADDATVELTKDGGSRAVWWTGDVEPARRDGHVPVWVRGIRIARRVQVDEAGVQVVERVDVAPVRSPTYAPSRGSPHESRETSLAAVACENAGGGSVDGRSFGAVIVTVNLPVGATHVRVRPDAQLNHGRPPEEPGTGWHVWQGGTAVRAEVRPGPGWAVACASVGGKAPSVAGDRPIPGGDTRRTGDGTAACASVGGNDGTLEVAYRLER